MTDEKSTTWDEAFMERLSSLSTGDRTALKRSLGASLQEADARATAAFYKAYWSGSFWDEDVCFLAACGVAAFYNLGGMKRSLQICLRELGASSRGVENKLLQLLDIPRKPETYFAVKLGRLLRQALSSGLNVDFQELLKDLHQWEHPSRFVQLKWAREFYVGQGRQPGAEGDSNNQNEDVKETEDHAD